MSIKTIAVFCGSAHGNNTTFSADAKKMACLLVENNIALVYGGGNVGLMGIIANETLALGGHVIGVIPEKLIKQEHAHLHLQELHIVQTMQERKNKMITIADAFIMMPGGVGSLDEFFEVIALNKLDYIRKPVAILNTRNYYDSLIAFLNHSIKEGFYAEKDFHQVIIDTDPVPLLKMINHCVKQNADYNPFLGLAGSCVSVDDSSKSIS